MVKGQIFLLKRPHRPSQEGCDPHNVVLFGKKPRRRRYLRLPDGTVVTGELSTYPQAQ